MASFKCPVCEFQTSTETASQCLQLAIHLIQKHVTREPASLLFNDMSEKAKGKTSEIVDSHSISEVGNDESDLRDYVHVKSEEQDDHDSEYLNIEEVLSTSLQEGSANDFEVNQSTEPGTSSVNWESHQNHLYTSEDEFDGSASEITIDYPSYGGEDSTSDDQTSRGRKRKSLPGGISSTPASKAARSVSGRSLRPRQAAPARRPSDPGETVRSSIIDGRKFYHCPECEFKTNFVKNIDRHVASVHRKERNYLCAGCGKGFTNKRALVRHEEANMADPNDPNDVMECSKYSLIRPNVEEHYKDLGHKFSCNHCGQFVIDMKEGKHHLIEKHRRFATIYTCNKCHARFFHKTHILNEHWDNCGKELVVEPKQEANLSLFQCPLCPYMTNKQEIVERHLHKVHLGSFEDLKCQGCHKVFCNQDELQRHVDENEPEPGNDYMRCAKIKKLDKPVDNCVQQISEDEFRCLKCKFVAGGLDRVRTHARQHFSNYPYQCNLCKVVFDSKKTAVHHLENYHGERFTDSTCDGDSSMQY